MKFASKVLALGALLLFLPASAAFAQAPSITPIGDVTLNVGGSAVVNVVAVDPNLDPITLTASGATFATLNPPTTGAGVVTTTMTLLPTLGASGEYTVTVNATANGQTDTETFVVHVLPTGSNLAPVVVAPPVQTVTEGSMLSFTVNASDANGDAITFLSASGLPSGAAFVTNSSNTSGTFTWTPNASQSGAYDVVFVAANGLEGSAATHIQVLDSTGGGNRPPVLSVPATLSLNEGATASFTLTASDLDGDHVTLSASGLPSGATFTDNGNNTASFSWTPGSTQSGTYTVTFTGNDGHGGVTSTTTVFTVIDVGGGGNQAPNVSVTPSVSVNEGANLTLTVTATDANGDHVTLSASGMPSGATFVDNGNNTGTLSWTPGFSQSGTYTITFTGNDGHGGVDTATSVVTVVNVSGGGNVSPDVTAPGSRTVSEGSFLTFTVSASDANGDDVTLTATGLPSGATFVDNDNNTGTFRWTPGSSQSGTYAVVFTGNDGHGGIDAATTVITVLDSGSGGSGNATATIIGKLKAKSKAKNVCFRIVPVNGSFDLRNVDEGSITLDFNGSSIAAVSKKTRVAFDCPDEDGHDGHDGHGGHGGHDGDDDDDCECDDDRHDAAAWDDDGDGDDDDTASCVATHLRACFSMREVRTLLGVTDVRDRLLQATISGDLNTGGSFVATIGTRLAHDGNGNGDGKGRGRRDLNCKASPNPLNPETKITFTLAQAGRVRMTIFDIQGRQVKTLIDEYRAVGDHEVRWDGSDVRQGRVASGLYFVKVQAPEAQVVQRITVLK
jgi:Putative Ig domain/Bacterial Ig domain/FlgD Ig-like domain